MMTSLSVLKRAPHMSVSRVKDFMLCPRRYALKYEHGERPDFRSAALALGVAWHVVIAAWLSGEAEGPALETMLRDEIHRELHAESTPVLFDDAEEDEERFIARATGMLRAFIAAVKKPRRVLGVEIPFSSEMVHPESGEVLDLPVIGALDALIAEGDGATLWELKTAAKKWSPEQLENDIQTTMYVKAVRELGYGDARPRLLVTTKTKVPGVQVADLVRSEVDERKLVELFLSVRRAVKAGVDHRLRSWACRTCPFAGACR
jgi:CRISPR/Cas system-associated exonuclease Cas4 (RecB family)